MFIYVIITYLYLICLSIYRSFPKLCPEFCIQKLEIFMNKCWNNMKPRVLYFEINKLCS